MPYLSGNRVRPHFVLAALLLLQVVVGGCASTRHRVDSEPSRAREEWPPSSKTKRSDLVREVERWRGTPYRYGGASSSGMDCSGFVRRVYERVYAVSLPRTTRAQMSAGQHVDENRLETGDLVFFRTPSRADHVGIYLGAGEFAHASTSSGVMISHLAEDYWKKAFRFGRRILEATAETIPALDEDSATVSRLAGIADRAATDHPIALPREVRPGW